MHSAWYLTYMRHTTSVEYIYWKAMWTPILVLQPCIFSLYHVSYNCMSMQRIQASFRSMGFYKCTDPSLVLTSTSSSSVMSSSTELRPPSLSCRQTHTQRMSIHTAVVYSCIKHAYHVVGNIHVSQHFAFVKIFRYTVNSFPGFTL